MSHRISAGAIVLDPERRIALVRHVKLGVYDFWVAPGGGVESNEDLRDAARREAFEEAGLTVTAGRLLYIEQLYAPVSKVHHVKHWFLCQAQRPGPLVADHASTVREGITEARWLERQDFAGKTIFPPVLNDRFWHDLANDFAEPHILPLRVMTFE